MKHVLVPAAQVLLVLLLGSMPIPRSFSQPLADASQGPSDQSPEFPSQPRQQPSVEGVLEADRDIEKNVINTTIPGENKVCSRPPP